MNRDDFEYWLFEMDDELLAFINSCPDRIKQKLDYSLNSLKIIEELILSTYSSIEEIMGDDNKIQLDRLSRYVGETLRKSIGGKWNIELEDEEEAFFHLPILIHEKYGIVCPVTIVTACIDRREGDYIYKVANARKRRLA